MADTSSNGGRGEARPPIVRAVVVTGASTGIGAACAAHLDTLGFRVFASVRAAKDAAAVLERSGGRITPILFDVTDEPAIRSAAAAVSDALDGGGLSGLVNNAGMSVTGPLEFLPLERLRKQLEVNVVGQIAVTQAFLPLLRKTRGRVVNIGSIMGRAASPFIGPYAASKFALEALTDALRMELRPWRIGVSIVEPGAIVTPIWEKAANSSQSLRDELPKEALALYGPALASVSNAAAKMAEGAIPAERVAEAVAHALTAKRPKTRYLVGREARFHALLIKIAPDRLADLLVCRMMGLP